MLGGEEPGAPPPDVPPVGVACGDATTNDRIAAVLRADGFELLVERAARDDVNGEVELGLASEIAAALPADSVLVLAYRPAELRRAVAALDGGHPCAGIVAVELAVGAGRAGRRLRATEVDGLVLEAAIETALVPTIRAVGAGQIAFPATARTLVQIPSCPTARSRSFAWWSPAAATARSPTSCTSRKAQ